jgi:integrase
VNATATRPRPGSRVRTSHEGVYRTVSARGPAFDKFTPKVGNKWLGTYPTEEEAVAARARVVNGNIPFALLTLNVFIALYWQQLCCKQRLPMTVKNMLGALKPLLAKFGDRRPADIQRMEALLWMDTVRRDNVRAARALFNDLAYVGLLTREENPFADARLPASTGRRYHTPPAMELMLDIADAARGMWDGYGAVFAAMIELALGTLMRPGELFILKWENVDFEESLIAITGNLRRDGTIGDRKTHQPAVIPLLPLARRALERLPRRLGSPYVFHAKAGGGMNHSRQQEYWTQLRNYYAGAAQQPDVTKLEFYLATRHAGATWLRNVAGVSGEDMRYGLTHNTDPDARKGRRAEEQARLVDLYTHPDAALARQRISDLASKQALPYTST